MTLKECLDKWGYGQGQKYQMDNWPPTNWFEPVLIARNKSTTSGHNDALHLSWYLLEDTASSWSLYQEPKKKVVRWLWTFNDCGRWFVTDHYCTEEEIYKYTKIIKYIKLEFSAVEFEE